MLHLINVFKCVLIFPTNSPQLRPATEQCRPSRPRQTVRLHAAPAFTETTATPAHTSSKKDAAEPTTAAASLKRSCVHRRTAPLSQTRNVKRNPASAPPVFTWAIKDAVHRLRMETEAVLNKVRAVDREKDKVREKVRTMDKVGKVGADRDKVREKVKKVGADRDKIKEKVRKVGPDKDKVRKKVRTMEKVRKVAADRDKVRAVRMEPVWHSCSMDCTSYLC